MDANEGYHSRNRAGHGGAKVRGQGDKVLTKLRSRRIAFRRLGSPKAATLERAMSKIKAASVFAIFSVLVLLLGAKAWGQPSMSVDIATGRIMIRAERQQIREVEGAISEFHLETRQIQIKARFLELSETATREFGIHLERLTGVKVPSGETPGEGTAIKLGEGAIQYSFYRLIGGEEKLDVIVKALIATGEAELLAEPRVSTLSGQVAGIYAVARIPYLTTEEVVRDEEVIAPEEWEYATVGIVLQVLPEIVGKDLVQMSIVVVVSDYDTKEFGSKHPVFYSDISPTNITVKSGEPIVTGGLMREKETETVAGLPILSELPIIGNLFKSRYQTTSKRNLIVTVEPHIITPREIKGRTKRVFVFKYALAEHMADRVREILSSQGMMEVNPREAPPNSILVRDNEDKIEDIQALLDEIGTFEQQRREETFELSYSTPEQIRKATSPLLSPRGSVRINEEAKSLTIEDGAYQLARMKEIISSIEKHNQLPQTKVFYLREAEREEVLPLLERYLSPQGSIQLEEERLVVVDNNWVIQRIAEEIARWQEKA